MKALAGSNNLQMGTLLVLGQICNKHIAQQANHWASPLIMGLTPFRIGTPSPSSHHSPRKLEIMRHHVHLLRMRQRDSFSFQSQISISSPFLQVPSVPCKIGSLGPGTV